MIGINLYIDKLNNDLLANKHGSYKFLYHNQSGGTKFHSQFDFKVTPFETNGNYETITIEFAETLERFDTVIKERFIYEGFKKGIEKFAQNLRETETNLSNSIKIEILDYTLHPIDSKPICNEICIEQVLNHIYSKTQLSDKAILEVLYEEYHTIHLKISDIEGISINNQFIKWGTPYEELSKDLALKHDGPIQNRNLKHFKGSKSINFSNIVINQAYCFDIGFNDKNEFIELSFHIGFKVKIDDWDINYCDSIEGLIKFGQQKGFYFDRVGDGNYFCENSGVIFSESSLNKSEFGKGFLEYIYFTQPNRVDR